MTVKKLDTLGNTSQSLKTIGGFKLSAFCGVIRENVSLKFYRDSVPSKFYSDFVLSYFTAIMSRWRFGQGWFAHN